MAAQNCNPDRKSEHVEALRNKSLIHINQMEIASHQIGFLTHLKFVRCQTESDLKCLKLKENNSLEYEQIIREIAIETWRLRYGTQRWHLVKDTATK